MQAELQRFATRGARLCVFIAWRAHGHRRRRLRVLEWRFIRRARRATLLRVRVLWRLVTSSRLAQRRAGQEGGQEGGRERGREGGREGGRERGRAGEMIQGDERLRHTHLGVCTHLGVRRRTGRGHVEVERLRRVFRLVFAPVRQKELSYRQKELFTQRGLY
jgi:hypothetical protein